MKNRITSEFDAGRTWDSIERNKPYPDVYRKLEEYENAEEDGRLFILPENLHVGDPVYEILFNDADHAHHIDGHIVKLEDIPKIGKTVFLTYQEAVEKLKSMKSQRGLQMNKTV